MTGRVRIRAYEADDASAIARRVTARPFFERNGFRVVREQRVSCRGVEMTNFAMEKPLAPPEED
jgi:hypothetical protein